MSNRLRGLKRKIKKKEIVSEPRKVKFARKRMNYECDSCGSIYRMWLELGLCEGGENHKPVPFVIGCKCGGYAKHIKWNEDIELPQPIEIAGHMNYFANYPTKDCGIPVLR